MTSTWGESWRGFKTIRGDFWEGWPKLGAVVTAVCQSVQEVMWLCSHAAFFHGTIPLNSLQEVKARNITDPRYSMSVTAQISPLKTLENTTLWRQSVDTDQQVVLQTDDLQIHRGLRRAFHFKVLFAQHWACGLTSFTIPRSLVDTYWHWEKRPSTNKMVKIKSSNV